MSLGFDLEEEEQKAFEPKRWMLKKIMELVTNETLSRVIDECIDAPGGYCAVDTETEGLNTVLSNKRTTHKIVGVCLSPDGIRGYYVPLRHKNGANVSLSFFIKEFTRLVESDVIILFHNAKFDHEMLQFSERVPLGLWEDPKKWDCTELLAYMRNTKEMTKKLKVLSKKDLGLEMIELKELFPKGTKNFDFSTLDPTTPGVLEYAASDAIITYLLFWKIKDEALRLPSTYLGKPGTQTTIYVYEKICVTATRWMERHGIKIDRAKVTDLIQLGQREYIGALRTVYEEASKILQRNIMPLSFVLLEERIAALNPDLKVYSITDSRDREKSFRVIREWSKKEADRLEKVWRVGGLESHMIPEKYQDLLNRKPPESEVTGKNKPLASYDITVPAQLGSLLLELGVEVKHTATGQVKTDKDTIKEILKKGGKDFPFLKKIRYFREIDKTLGNYLYYLYEDMRLRWVCKDCHCHTIVGRDQISPNNNVNPDLPKDGKCIHCGSTNIYREDRVKVQFRGDSVDTGRFKVKAGKNPARDGQCRVPFHGIPNAYDEERPECMRRLRECVIPEKGRTIVATDFDGVELRIVTNLSREPKWISQYFRCSDCGHEFPKKNEDGTAFVAPPYCPKCKSSAIGDLHTLTALGVYGEDSRSKPGWKQKRQWAKNSNFALCYGGSSKAVKRTTGCTEPESHRIKKRFDGMYQVLPQWWAGVRNFAKKWAYVLTACNRKYPVPDVHHEENFIQAKALRNAINSPVQGTSADLTKIAMAKIYLVAKNRGWIDPEDHLNDKIVMLIQMHDELVFEIDDDILEEAIEVIEYQMTNNTFVRKLRYPVPFTVDTELGPNWSVPFGLRALSWGIKPWPEHLIPLFPKAVALSKERAKIWEKGEDKPPSSSPYPSPPPTSEPEPEPEPEPNTERQQDVDVDPKISSGGIASGKTHTNGTLTYKVNVPWTMPILEVIAGAIHGSLSEQGQVLRLRSRGGSELGWPQGKVKVDRERFLNSLRDVDGEET